MGLKSKLNKMKNFLFDEEEVERPEKKKAKKKKEIVKEEIIQKPTVEEKDFDDFYFDDISEEEDTSVMEVKSRISKESEFKFPEFNDEDFMTSVRQEVEPIIKKEETKPILYQGSKRREETKKFKPSPIISPIYGLLDEEGNRVKKEVKTPEATLKTKDDLTFDEIRKKAYGNLDEQLENTISRLNKKTIEEAEAEMEKEEKEIPSRTSEKSKSKITYEKPIVVETDSDDDDMVLPNVNLKEIDIDKEYGVIEKSKTKSKTPVLDEEDEDDEDTKEQDLFNLIDTIYSGEENNK